VGKGYVTQDVQSAFHVHSLANPVFYAHINISPSIGRIAGTQDTSKKKDFATLGGVLHLGHCGSPCNLGDSRHTRRIIITHINGVHKTNVSFCACVGSSDQWEQLMRRRLFPATFTSPESAFTIDFLKLAHLTSLNCHVSIHSISMAFRQLTNDPQVHRVLVSLYLILKNLFCSTHTRKVKTEN
jgi:hypothetical protein